MKPIPSYRAAHMAQHLKLLRKIGVPVERELQRFKLPTLPEETPDAYLPLLPSIAFGNSVSRKEGIDEFSIRSLCHLRLEDLSKELLTLVRNVPTLKLALELFARLAPLEDPYIRVVIEEQDDMIRVHAYEDLDLDEMAKRYPDWNILMCLIAVIREFTGQHWKPASMGFRSRIPIGNFSRDVCPNTHFHLGEETAWLTLPRSYLALPHCSSRLARNRARNYSQGQENLKIEIVTGFTDSLKQILPAYMNTGYPSIRLAAELAGTSVRTLQRRLGQSGLTYSDLVQQARFENAAEILASTDQQIIQISTQLGYEDAAHFSRAFKRMAGVTPSKYRAMHQQASQGGVLEEVA